MTWTVWAAIGFVIGCLFQLVFQKKTVDDKKLKRPWLEMLWKPRTAPAQNQPSASVKTTAAKAALVVVTVILAVIALNHDAMFASLPGWNRPCCPLPEPDRFLDFEEWLVKSRFVWALLWAIAGWLAAEHRAKISHRLDQLYTAFLGGDHPSPWALQSGLAVLALFGVVLAFRPALLEKIQSVRAGDLEAKFDSASSKLKEFPKIKLNLYFMRETLTIWDKFGFFPADPNSGGPDLGSVGDCAAKTKENARKFCRIGNKTKWADGDPTFFDTRLSIYYANNYCFNKILITEILMRKYIRPLISSLTELKKLDEPAFERMRYDQDVKRAVAAATSAVNANGIDPVSACNTLRAIKDIQKSVDNRIKVIKNYSQELLACNKGESTEENPGVKCDPQKTTASDPLEADVKFLVDEDKKAKKCCNEKETYYPWEAYIVALVSDLVAFAGNQADKAHFLDRIKDRYPLNQNCASYNQSTPLPGSINFHGYLADAMLHSEDYAFSVERIQNELDHVDAAIHCLIESDWLKDLDKTKHRWNEIERIYRRNLIVDLPLYMELYVSAVVSGRKLSAPQIEKWKLIYARSRKFVRFFNGYGEDMKGEGANAEVKWLEAKTEIEKEPYLLQETAMWAALSAIFIPAYAGESVGAAQCSEAKTLIALAKSESRFKAIKDSGDKSDYDVQRMKALNEQAEAAIEQMCGP